MTVQVMTDKSRNAIADGLCRQMPIKGTHHGRGMWHSEQCYNSCFDSWQRCVNEMAWVLFGNTITATPGTLKRRERFIERANGRKS